MQVSGRRRNLLRAPGGVSDAVLRCVSPILILVLVSGANAQDQVRPPQRTDIFDVRTDLLAPLLATRSKPGSRVRPRELANSTSADSEAYYRAIGKSQAFESGAVPATLDEMLRAAGYQLLSARDLDQLPPRQLMDYAFLRERYPDPQSGTSNEFAGGAATWDVLAAAYFAPKTSDVSGKSNKVSWRKVVRLKPRADSRAAAGGVQAIWFLSVAYIALGDTSDKWLTGSSQIVQVALSIDPDATTSALPDTTLFLIYDPARGYQLTNSSITSWDSADPAFADQQGETRYFVPAACIQCHGGQRESATLHFFDTDYSLDRVLPGDDFQKRVRTDQPLLFVQSATDNRESEERNAMAVLRTLNQEILNHNEQVAADSLATAGGRNWRRLHANNLSHRLPIERGWAGANGIVWTATDETDRDLLPLLNRYCYRCHGTISYSVFDKEYIVRGWGDKGEFIDEMLRRLEADRPERMPLDRDLPEKHPEDFKQLRLLLKQLKANQSSLPTEVK